MPTPRKKPPKVQGGALERAIALLQEQGFRVLPPNIAADDATRQQTEAALGLKRERLRSGKAPRTLNTWTLQLTFPHTQGGVSYGPGEVVVRDPRIAQSLLYADQQCKEQEERVFEQVSRCHLIIERQDASGRKAAYAQRVPPTFFDSGAGLMNAPVYREFSPSSRAE